MLLAGSDDGVYRLQDIGDPEATAERVLETDRVYRLRQFDGLDGLLAASVSGLYHTADGRDWHRLGVPEDEVYAVAASPSGETIYAGTRPAHVYAADARDGLPTDRSDWTALPGFEDLRETADWGLPRHDGMAQVRSLHTHSDTPDRLVAGLEVGGVFVSDDRGDTWSSRHPTGFDAPHTNDVHELAQGDSGEYVAATGSGLYRTTDAGRTWARLDDGHSQRYFRAALVHDGVIYAGGAHGPSPTWNDDTDHALLEYRDGTTTETAATPASEELAIGWCVAEGDVLAATHRGTVLRRAPDGYEAVGSVPTPGGLRGRYLPVTWLST